MSLNIRPYLAV